MSKEYTNKLRKEIDDELLDEAKHINEYEIDFDNLPVVKHNWVKRGDIVSCEGAGHPNHRHYIKREIV
jgi:hypothetical protein